MKQKGFIHLLPLLVVVLIAAVAYLLLAGKVELPFISKKQPKVELKTTYENPLKKDTQYVNPFEKSKNPFVTGR